MLFEASLLTVARFAALDMIVHRTVAARTVCGSTNSVSSTRSRRRLLSSPRTLFMDRGRPGPPWLVPLMVDRAQMDTIPGKENNPCCTVRMANLWDLPALTASLNTATHHRRHTDILLPLPLRVILSTRLPTWPRTHLLPLDLHTTHKGRLNRPSMMIVSV